ncbi:MAG: GNAT family N-acetyltransferase [Flavobacteriales bacterium]|nr:GNAT family N-acetyltransferase [Flavobacteriales bacterium]
MSTVIFSKATTDEHIDGIVALQQRNLPRNLTADERNVNGFLTVEHSSALLWEMNRPYRHIIALDADEVVGYALAMEKVWKDKIHVLLSMFSEIEKKLRSLKKTDLKYYVMGQICVDNKQRGKGVFRQLYKKLHDQMRAHFDLCITEIDERNQRSVQAHLAVGFKEFHRYTDEQGVNWVIVCFNYT